LDLSLGVDPVIGVISKVEQAATVEEFFELFKTPWEYYVPGRTYNVIVATTHDIPTIDTGVLLVFGPETKSTDAANSIAVRLKHTGGSVDFQGVGLPIFGALSTFEEGSRGTPCLMAKSGVAGLRLVSKTGTILIRVGYDLMQEVQLLLSAGQPIEFAHVPTLEIHISMLRYWILSAGISLLEIPPAPAGHGFTVCLTHDIDFVGIKNHKFDHTMWGFLYRSTVGALSRFFRKRISFGRLLVCWRAAASLPFVYIGWVKDFWIPFEWYLRVEKNLPATYFVIPFKRRGGEQVPGKYASRRASAYGVADILRWTTNLQEEGCELGVHGIDGWHSVEKGCAELTKIAEVSGKTAIGVRTHWLLQNNGTASVLDEAGYFYDSTAGYNETIGYRCGTTQVFRPLSAKALLELPMHIQDGAMFYGNRLDLTEPQAHEHCQQLIENAGQYGGVLTVLWHDRSHGPERFWGDFYVNLLEELKSSDAWFATAGQAVSWFRKRRSVKFERRGAGNSGRICPGSEEEDAPASMRLRVYRPSSHDSRTSSSGREMSTFTDIPWDAASSAEFDLGHCTFSDLPDAATLSEISSS
jgi:hypothetical protein